MFLRQILYFTTFLFNLRILEIWIRQETEGVSIVDCTSDRRQVFEAGFKRWFRILRIVTSIAGVASFNEEGQLFVEFTDPIRPVDTKQQEEVWSVRIAEKRATEIDYLMEVKGLTQEEAFQKYIEIVEFNAQKQKLIEEANAKYGVEPAVEQPLGDEEYDQEEPAKGEPTEGQVE